MKITIKEIFQYLRFGNVPDAYTYLKEASIKELESIITTLDRDSLEDISHGACAYKLHKNIQVLDRVNTINSIKVHNHNSKALLEDSPNLKDIDTYAILTENIDLTSYPKEIIAIKEGFLDELAKINEEGCSSCDRNSLLRKWNNKLLLFINNT